MAYGNYAPFYRGGYFNPMQMPTMPNMAETQSQFNPQYQTPTQPTPQPMQNPITQPVQATNDIIWVQGEAGAKAYFVSPNNTVTLWDSENPTIYIKTTDMNGVPSMRILDFTERTINAPKTPAEHVCKCGDKFATIESVNALQGKLEELTARFEEITATTPAKSRKSKENVDNG